MKESQLMIKCEATTTTATTKRHKQMAKTERTDVIIVNIRAIIKNASSDDEK